MSGHDGAGPADVTTAHAPHAPDHVLLHAGAAAEAVEAGLAALRARGERVTGARRRVIEALASTPEHLSADEVATMLAGTDVHRATVYRSLDALVEAGAVSLRHSAGGAARYHLATTSRAHSHLHGHCRSCGLVVTLPADALDEVVARVDAETGFLLQAGQSALEGLCRDCRV